MPEDSGRCLAVFLVGDVPLAALADLLLNLDTREILLPVCELRLSDRVVRTVDERNGQNRGACLLDVCGPGRVIAPGKWFFLLLIVFLFLFLFLFRGGFGVTFGETFPVTFGEGFLQRLA